MGIILKRKKLCGNIYKIILYLYTDTYQKPTKNV